jgi:hypothetical protein
MDVITIADALILAAFVGLHAIAGGRWLREAGISRARPAPWFLQSRTVVPSDAPPGDGAEVVAREAGPAIICERLPRPEWMERRA